MKKLYYGGDIISMKGERDFPEALLEEDGEILYTGTLTEARKRCGEHDVQINLEGTVLMPSFIDAHSHFFQTAQNILMCDLSEAKSFEDIYRTLKQYMEKNQIAEDGVVFASGYDHNVLEEGRHPDGTLLDRVSESVPIYLSHVSGHMGVSNSAMFRLAKITPDTPDPKGGRFGRTEDGRLSGYVEETPALMRLLEPALPRMKMDLDLQLELAQEQYFRYGITTAQEGALMGQNMQELANYAARGKLKLDVVGYVLENEYEKTIRQFPEYNQNGQNRLRIGGAKIILDGSPQGKSAWLSMPYEGESDYRGYPTHEDAYVEHAVLCAVKGGYQILAHCNGDAASEQFIRSYEKALRAVDHADRDLRPVMIHCQTVRDDQLDRMREIGMIPSLFIGHTYYWGDVHLKNLGRKRGAAISPARSALERGLIYNFHQDTPVTKPDMLHSVWCAVNRRTRSGKAIGEEQKIRVFDALKGVTINAAYEYHEENQKGTLEAGKKADMVILDANPLSTDPMRIREIRVLETIKDGKTVYRLEDSNRF